MHECMNAYIHKNIATYCRYLHTYIHMYTYLYATNCSYESLFTGGLLRSRLPTPLKWSGRAPSRLKRCTGTCVFSGSENALLICSFLSATSSYLGSRCQGSSCRFGLTWVLKQARVTQLRTNQLTR